MWLHRRPNAIRESAGDRAFLVGVYVILALILVAVLYPMIYILSCSFSSADDVQAGHVWLWPVHPTLLGYQAVFQNDLVVTSFFNSVFYTLVGGAFSTIITIMMAYPLSRKYFIGRRIWIWLLLFAFVFNGGLIPFYLVVKDLGLLDTRWALIFPSALGIFQVFLAKTFFQTSIPSELYDSARLDGCSELQFLLRVVLPTSYAIIAVLFLLYAVGQWNSYFNALIFLENQSLYPLQLVLRSLLIVGQNAFQTNSGSMEEIIRIQAMNTLLRYAVIVVATVPMLVIYPFAQRYFVKGVMLGSLKE
jgi:ABC-type glycerol-3-phosphate transport system permease component